MATTETKISSEYSIPLFLALVTAGLAGNYFKYPIFLNIDFLFGSIFAMLALQFFRLGRGIIAAAVIAGYTYILWNHPYAIIILTAEVAFVGLLMNRRKMGMVLADALYWLVIGMPLVYLFYHICMNVPPSSTYITMTKQALNGIANALTARLVFTGIVLRSRSALISYREIIYNLLTAFVLFPALVVLAISSHGDFKETDRNIRLGLMQNSQRMNHYVVTWIKNRKLSVINLANIAVSKTPQQMQPYLELVRNSDANYPKMGLLDKTATITAYSPLVDELGKSTIGLSAADRPYLPILKKELKPMLSEVLIGRVGTPKPRVFMLAPVVIRGEFGGYIVGVLSLDQIREQLEKSLSYNAMFYTLLDRNGGVIMTNRTDQKVLSPFVRDKGEFKPVDTIISQWTPKLPNNIPMSERWKKSFYVAETAIGDLAEWKLILEQPVAPFQKALFDKYTARLLILFMILLGALIIAEMLSRRIIYSIETLSRITLDIPAKLAKADVPIIWPETAIDVLVKQFHNSNSRH